MGELIATKCRNCNFENTFNYGGSRFNYLTTCLVPAIDIEIDEFQNVNYYSEKDNPKFKFYSDAELKGDNHNQNTLDNFDLKLNTINNYCPCCKNYSFDFRITMFY
jgi:hypothetical protein